MTRLSEGLTVVCLAIRNIPRSQSLLDEKTLNQELAIEFGVLANKAVSIAYPISCTKS